VLAEKGLQWFDSRSELESLKTQAEQLLEAFARLNSRNSLCIASL
jgi:hypothetical protein